MTTLSVRVEVDVDLFADGFTTPDELGRRLAAIAAESLDRDGAVKRVIFAGTVKRRN